MSELSRDNQGVLSSDRVSFESVGDLFVVGWICCEQKEAACRLIKPVVHTDIAMVGAQQLIKACAGWGLLTGYARGFVDDQNALLMVDCGVSRHVELRQNNSYMYGG